MNLGPGGQTVVPATLQLHNLSDDNIGSIHVVAQFVDANYTVGPGATRNVSLAGYDVTNTGATTIDVG